MQEEAKTAQEQNSGRDPNKHKNLIYNKSIPNQCGKDGLFSKWCWNNQETS